MVRFALWALRIYLLVQLSLIGLKFARMDSQSKQDSKAGAAAPKAPGESGKSGQ